MQIVPVDPRAIEVAFGVEIDMPAVAVVGIEGETVIGSGGLAWGGGKCWLWFTAPNGEKRHALAIWRAAERLKRKARQLGETEIWTIRDTQYETAKRLLEATGFEFYAVEDGNELYRCAL